jgi:hypothetical protein
MLSRDSHAFAPIETPIRIRSLVTTAAGTGGFKHSMAACRVMEVSQPAQVDFVLQPGETSQSVTVTAEGAALLTASDSEVGGMLTADMLDNLPLNGHDFFRGPRQIQLSLHYIF